MNIRSVTLFCQPSVDPGPIAPFIAAARAAFDVPVQSVRVATTPFPDWWQWGDRWEQPLADWVGGWRAAGVDYVCLGPVQAHHAAHWLDRLPAVFAAHDSVFAAGALTGTGGRIDLDRIGRIARLIVACSTIYPNGFGNLYFTATANCAPGSPYFPVAYHGGGPPRFALALESADLALDAVRSADSPADAQQRLTAGVTRACASVAERARRLAADFAMPFAGIDCALAPFPTADRSLGGALEALGVPTVGAAGSLFAAALVTDALKQADYSKVGFNGLMLPVLEDSVLALRAAEGQLTLTDLLAYSAVCGVGLDTVPLPGAVSAEQLAAVLLDVAALAVRLDKPLTARLMPMPGRAAGDPIAFDFPYFADSRVMPLASAPPGGLIARGGSVALRPLSGAG